MKRHVLRIVGIAAISAGGVLPLAAPAQADAAGLLNGNQVNTSISVSINISGNAVAIGGFASAGDRSSDSDASTLSGKWSVFKLLSRTWS